jgi:DNA-directed RNA polymerase beta subunit
MYACFTARALIMVLPRHRCTAGYDMEDAMILNKSSVERGFAHAYLYKTETVDLREDKGK